LEQLEHLLETLRVLPHVAALVFAYGPALPVIESQVSGMLLSQLK
jgi:hypothetical protein